MRATLLLGPGVVGTVGGLFTDLDFDASMAKIGEALAVMDAWNERYARSGAYPFPLDPAAGLTYRREPKFREVWQTLPYLVAGGVGDCEDLASALAGWWRAQGIDAKSVALVMRRSPPLIHVVTRAEGVDVDPSRYLGMTGRA